MIAKKTLITALAMVFAALCANAQSRLGIKAGGAFSWIPGTTIYGYERVVPHNNFYAGISYDMELSDLLVLEADLVYTGKGYSDKNELSKYSRNLSYLELPILVGAKMSNDRLSLMLGPQVGYLLGSFIKDNGVVKNTKDQCNPVEVSLVLQADYMFTDSFGVDFKIDYGFTRVVKEFAGIQDKGRNLSVEIGLCYKFEL